MLNNCAYRTAAMDEEKVLKQKTKVEWLKEGDQNSAYFYNLLKGRLNKSRIVSVKDDMGPGPDDFTSKFFKASWETVGMDLCDAVKKFFLSGKMLGELNTTLISLVPKCKIPEKVTDYRLIACCNVVYKCISKVITNRIKVVLNGLIDSNQSAFIEGRQISNNIMLAQELMCRYLNKNKVARYYGGLDYGMPEISFILYLCESHGFFKAVRGLRQGDPISPYLFTIVMEVFTQMLKRQIQSEKKFIYHWGCRELEIVNLCFADDLMLFCHGDVISVSVLRRSIDEFCLSSRLRPNMAKSTVYFGNVEDEVKREIKVAIPFNEGLSLEDRWKEGGCKYSVSWKEVCKPKSEGGLGFKSFQVWNEALMAKHLWDILIDKDSIWVKWVKGQWLKNDSIWAVEVHDHTSWGWKQIFSLRNKVRNFIHFKIGNGKKCFFWFDKWNENGPLCKLVNYASIMQSSLVMKTKVADLILNEKWNWPRSWSVRFREVLEIQVPAINEEFEDKAIWINKKGKEKIFCVSEVWKERNIRLFGNDSRTEEELFKTIFEVIRSRLVGLKLKATLDVIKAAEVWNIPIYKMHKYKNILDDLETDAMDLDDNSFLGCSELVDVSSESDSQDQEYSYILEIHGMMKTKSDRPCNDVGWHSYSCLSSCLRVSAYGDVLSYADWSQCNLVIQSMWISFENMSFSFAADDYDGSKIRSMHEFCYGSSFVM
ncbi:RNA-directed DNA polymerase, eukaryota, reverse transcriptase zinc-binding domain protein [Tanacetum coccineum]